jgi:DNA repair exonuclease SbcCD ATPase subunit
MIRRLRIEGWRAFDDVTLDLGPGLTFVVAENGVGKTSLVQAAAWGLYGGLSNVDARAARRIGSQRSRVTVELELPDGHLLAVEREAHERGETAQARIAGGPVLDDAEVAERLAGAFGASREFLSRTTLLPSDAVADDAAGAFHLQAHLRRVFGVDDLRRAADELQSLHDQAQAEARKVRQATRRATADLNRLRAQLAEAEAAEAAARAARAEARAVLTFADGQLAAARQRAAVQARVNAAAEHFAELLATARGSLGKGARLGRITKPAELATRLEAAEAAATEELDGHRREAATVSGRLAAVRAAAASLHAADAECPVCRRDLSPTDVARAGQTHERELAALAGREAELAALVETATRRVAELRGLSRQALRLPSPSDVDASGADDVPDVETAAFAVDAARADLERLDEAAAEARARRGALAGQVEEEERVVAETQRAARAHRREAVTRVAAEVMRGTADAILAERIDPLAAEVGHRWKRVFGERGALRLRGDGQLVLVRGVHEIPFSQFSSGEKVVALLATRLLVLGASTRASFLWLDEPLEHLDPRNRRITASLMNAAGRHVRQILVTTYEEALARRLAAAASAELRYVRTTEPL